MSHHLAYLILAFENDAGNIVMYEMIFVIKYIAQLNLTIFSSLM